MIGRWLFNLGLGVGMFMLLWLGLAYYVQEELEFEDPIVPYPAQVWDAFQSERVQEDLPTHIETSTRRILRGLALATVLAWPLGVIMGQSRFINRLFSPLLNLTYPIPKIVFLPVVIILFDTGDESRVVLITLVVFFQIFVVVRDEALDIAPELLESVRSLGAGRRALFWYVYIPASFGAVLTGLRVSVGVAVAVLFISETSLTREGLGYYITLNSQRLRYPEMYVGILSMSLLGVVLYAITDVLERVFRRWRRNVKRV